MFSFAGGRGDVKTSKLDLGDVLMWLTGARYMPAVGIQTNVTVTFEPNKKTPFVSTCGPILRLPICPQSQQGRMSCDTYARWILDSIGFGQV